MQKLHVATFIVLATASAVLTACRSKEPGEDWKWCYAYDALVRAEVS